MNDLPPKKLFLIDVMPLLYRGHFAFLKSPRLTSAGVNTSALTGFASSLFQILGEHAPTHVALALDPEGPTFRHEAYPDYKAQRQKAPEDIVAAVPMAVEIADALGIRVLRVEGFEADDVMGTLAVRAAAFGSATAESADKNIIIGCKQTIMAASSTAFTPPNGRAAYRRAGFSPVACK